MEATYQEGRLGTFAKRLIGHANNIRDRRDDRWVGGPGGLEALLMKVSACLPIPGAK